MIRTPQSELPRRPIVWEDTASLEAHPELHHYTTYTGLKGIFESNTLWATHFGDLNDASELTFIQSPLERDLSLRFKEILRARRTKSAKIDRALSAVGGLNAAARFQANRMVSLFYASTFTDEFGLTGVKDLKGPAFISSFCTHTSEPYEREHGLLSQWRGYGGYGGFCIVFDTMKLFELLDLELGAACYMSAAMDQVTYLRADESVARAFPKVMSTCEGMLNYLLNNNMKEPDDIFSDFIMAATYCKHFGFHEEREIRIALRPATDGWIETVRSMGEFAVPPKKEVEGGGSERRRIVLFKNIGLPLPIKRVIVGPSNSQEDGVAAAMDLVKGAVSVTKSETPYIER